MAIDAKAKIAAPCKKCGLSERNARGGCVECARVSRLKYRLNNPDKVKASTAAYLAKQGRRPGSDGYHAERYLANREKAIENAKRWRKENAARAKDMAKAWYDRNAEKLRAAARAWAKANPESRKVSKQNRRARKRQSGGILSKGLASRLFRLQKGKCPCCGLPLGRDYHLDHKMPLALGGSNTDDNMQLLRSKCNLQKSKQHPIDFMRSRGFLL